MKIKYSGEIDLDKFVFSDMRSLSQECQERIAEMLLDGTYCLNTRAGLVQDVKTEKVICNAPDYIKEKELYTIVKPLPPIVVTYWQAPVRVLYVNGNLVGDVMNSKDLLRLAKQYNVDPEEVVDLDFTDETSGSHVWDVNTIAKTFRELCYDAEVKYDYKKQTITAEKW